MPDRLPQTARCSGVTPTWLLWLTPFLEWEVGEESEAGRGGRVGGVTRGREQEPTLKPESPGLMMMRLSGHGCTLLLAPQTT